MNKEKLKEDYLSNITGDIFGGLTAAVVALPIALAFGVASGLGAKAGLYSAIAAGFFAAMFGGTKGQVSGPTGPMTVVTALLVQEHAGRPELVFAAVGVCGIFQILLGRLKVGQLIQYFPYPVISGFMTGIGVIIVLIQVNPLFGLPSKGGVFEALQDLATMGATMNQQALVIGVLTIAIIYLIPFLSKLLRFQLPATLIALVLGTLASVYLNFDLPRITDIPRTLPVPTLPSITFADLHLILQAAISLALLGAIDTLLTSVVIDKITRTRHDSDRELTGQGIGNIVAGLMGGLPSAGATMRSVVNINAGGRTKLSGILQSVFLLVVLLTGATLAENIPLSCLAGILITVGISIVDRRAIKTISRTPRTDVIVMFTVLLFTIFVDLIAAVVAGIALACILFAKSLSDQSASHHGLLDSVEQIEEQIQHLPRNFRQGVYVYSLHGPLYFGEVKNFNEAIQSLPSVKYLILRFYNVPFTDQTGALALEDAVETCRSKGARVLLVGVKPHIMEILEGAGVLDVIGKENFIDEFDRALDLIANIQRRTHQRLESIRVEPNTLPEAPHRPSASQSESKAEENDPV